MATCTQCSIANAERTQNKRGVAVAIHNDCAELEDMLVKVAQADPSTRAVVQDAITRLNKKKQGLPVQWP